MTDNLPTRERISALADQAYNGYVDDWTGDTHDEIAAILSAYLRLTQENEWIAVTERLPAPGTYIGVATGNPWHKKPFGTPIVMEVDFTTPNDWMDYEGKALIVTHWRPLPPPPVTPSENSTGGGK